MFVSVLISQIRTGLELVNIKCTHNGFVLYMYCKSVLSSLITEFTDIWFLYTSMSSQVVRKY